MQRKVGVAAGSLAPTCVGITKGGAAGWSLVLVAQFRLTPVPRTSSVGCPAALHDGRIVSTVRRIQREDTLAAPSPERGSLFSVVAAPLVGHPKECAEVPRALTVRGSDQPRLPNETDQPHP